jgi:hypothetical protein
MSATGKKPWHERFSPWGYLRARLRRGLFAVLQKLAATNDARRIATDLFRSAVPWQPDDLGPVPASPYAGLGGGGRDDPAATGEGAIFITGRFRSGSTLLWNLFRNLGGFTAYYEPLNERRWFDPAARGNRTDPTHRNVSDYWKEYDGLELLGRYYREDWVRRHLLMDAAHWDPDMVEYVRLLLRKAPGRPVLQFNRIDFRLPWYRRHFPAARIVHLYRHPRDQWCSALMDSRRFPPSGKPADFLPHDRFYLLTWAEDLKYHFPFLDSRRADHPYELFYHVWKLSYLFGRRYAHHSLAFEDLVAEPEVQLEKLLTAVDAGPGRSELTRLKSIIVKPPMGKWKEYAGDDWFRAIESKCETVLSDFLAPAADRPAPLIGSPFHRNGCRVS